MKITGIIVEYNPLHNGHLHHISKTKEKSKCDILIAVMSGNFMQRGEPAIIDKHLRTMLAIKSGVDLVVELPYSYAVQSADIFALGAIKILNELGVDDIYFGSESDNVKSLELIAKLLDSKHFNEIVKEKIKEGISYPSACSYAIKKLTNINDRLYSNDILGIQYIRNILKINNNIMYHTIKRIHSNYNDESFTHSNIASATSIRNSVLKDEDISNFVPSYTLEILNKKQLVSWDDYFPYLKYQIISNQANLSKIHDVNEGIENAIFNNIHKVNNFNDLINSLISKRYTKSKIKRIMCHILNNITKEEININKLQYIKILGFNKEKSNLIKNINGSSNIQLITNINKKNYQYVKLDEKVSQIYHLCDNSKSRKIPVII